MKVEIDTVKEEIIIVEATMEELLDLCETYEGFTVRSKVEVQVPFQVPTQPIPYEPYRPYEPFIPNSPWYTGTTGNIDCNDSNITTTNDENTNITISVMTPDQVNKEYFG